MTKIAGFRSAGRALEFPAQIDYTRPSRRRPAAPCLPTRRLTKAGFSNT